MKSSKTGYGTIAVLIHWTSALLVIVLIGSGFRSGFAEDAAAKASALRVHVPVASLVLLLTLGRLLWWWRFDRKPEPLPGTPGWQETIALWTHRALYLLLLLLLVSGIATAAMSGLPDALFGSGEFPDLSSLPPRLAHGLGARLIAAFVTLHAGAALYHHWILKDRTLNRMWFRKS